MPTQVDIALSKGKEGIEAAVAAQNEVTSTAAAAATDQQDLSPLFRDEVQRHEMRYLDTFLSPDRPSNRSIAECNEEDDNSNVSSNADQCVGQVFHQGLNYQPSELTRIAKLMGTNNYHDSPVSAAKTINNPAVLREETPAQDHSSAEVNISYTRHATINKTKSSKNKDNKANSKRPTPSANKKRQFNNRFMRKVKLKSRQVATSMIKNANRCTRKASVLSHMIRGSVASAVNRIHVLLDETRVNSTNVLDSKAPIRNEPITTQSQRRESSAVKNVPPLNAFAPKWAGAQLVKQQAKHYIDNSMLSGKNT
jgi:hypothetical protein